MTQLGRLDDAIHLHRLREAGFDEAGYLSANPDVAAAVASGIVRLAMGTDTGGSIRQPAAFTGIVGIKPDFFDDESQQIIAQQSMAAYQQAMAASGDSRAITTRILPLAPFYYAEDYHQQYLEKNPEGYCGLGGIGVCLPPSLNR